MKLPIDTAEDGTQVQRDGEPYDFGLAPEIAGLALTAAIVFILFYFADGAF